MILPRVFTLLALGTVGLVTATDSLDSVNSLLPRAYPGYVTPDGRIVPVPESELSKRDDGPDVAELIKACPGAGDGGNLGNKGLTKAKLCGLIKKQQTGPSYSKLYELDYAPGFAKEVRNCDDTADAIMNSELDATKTVTQTWSVKLSIEQKAGIPDVFSVNTGVSLGYGHSNSTATTTGHKISVPAGERCTWASTTWFQPMTGTMVINFGENDKVKGHWYWLSMASLRMTCSASSSSVRTARSARTSRTSRSTPEHQTPALVSNVSARLEAAGARANSERWRGSRVGIATRARRARPVTLLV